MGDWVNWLHGGERHGFEKKRKAPRSSVYAHTPVADYRWLCAAVDAQWRVRGAAGSAWGAMHCLGHYAKVRRTAGVRLQPTIDTREDTCTRSPSSMHRRTHETTSVVLVPSLRIAYVEILKGASSTVRQMLSSAFKANYDTCGGRTLPPYVKDAATSCGTRRGDDRMRCTTSCLTPSEVEGTSSSVSCATQSSDSSPACT